MLQTTDLEHGDTIVVTGAFRANDHEFIMGTRVQFNGTSRNKNGNVVRFVYGGKDYEAPDWYFSTLEHWQELRSHLKYLEDDVTPVKLPQMPNPPVKFSWTGLLPLVGCMLAISAAIWLLLAMLSGGK